MSTKSIEYAGVNIEVKEDKKSPIVNIITADADIYVNGTLIWQQYEQDEYEFISPILRSFISRNNPYLERREKNKDTLAEFDVENQSVAFIIPFNTNKPITARVDLINSMEILESDYIRNTTVITEETADKIMFKLKKIWMELEQKVQASNFTLSYSHSMGESYYGWWDIDFLLKNWNEQNFIEVMKLVDKFNKTLNEYQDKYNF